MKNIKVILSALVLSMFTSCQDAIDITQPGEVGPTEIFKTADDLQKGLYGVYGQFSVMNEISFNSIWTDEVRLGFANGGQGLNDGTYGFVLNVNSPDATSIWGSNYALIDAANRVIEGAESVIPKTSDDEVKKQDVLAQARAIRAWGHFRLLSYFSEDLTDDNKLGVIIMDHVASQTEANPRSTNKDVYDFINADLDYAEGNLVSNAGNQNRNYVSVDFINAFRARMNAYRGQYTLAADYAQLIIDSYPLTDLTGYPQLWLDNLGEGSADEVIFRIDHIKGGARIGNIWASVNATVEGSPFFAVSTDLFQLLYNYNDVRFATFISQDSDIPVDLTKTYDPGKIVIRKYYGTETTNADGTKSTLSLLNDEKIFRSSEMYFIMAEARAAAGDFSAATGVAYYLQQVNNARLYSPTTIAEPANAKAAWAEILKQRRIELCYEGHRYLDLKRLGVKAGVDINRNAKDCYVNGACYLPANSYKFTMPIPNAELRANLAIKGQQNAGY